MLPVCRYTWYIFSTHALTADDLMAVACRFSISFLYKKAVFDIENVDELSSVLIYVIRHE